MDAARFDTALDKANKRLTEVPQKPAAGPGKIAHEAGAGYAPKITFVLFNEITTPSPAQSRARVFDVYTYPEDRELLESIKTRGVVTPIIVRDLGLDSNQNGFGGSRRRGKRSFALISGHRRVEAGKLAGLKGVPGILARNDDDHELMTLAENMGRRELTTYEKATAIRSLKEERGLTVRKTAEVTGLSPSAVSRMLTSFDAPEILQELWKNGRLSYATLGNLKKHWGEFDKDLPTATLSKIESLSKRDAEELCAQLDMETGLESALQSMGSLDGGKAAVKSGEGADARSGKARPADGSHADDNKLKGGQKEAISQALGGVFPKITEEHRNTLFDLAIVSNVKDTEVLWAAALYVARGGKPDLAIAHSLKALQDRKTRSLVTREIKQAKQVSSHLKSLKRGNKHIKQFLKTVFAGS